MSSLLCAFLRFLGLIKAKSLAIYCGIPIGIAASLFAVFEGGSVLLGGFVAVIGAGIAIVIQVSDKI